MEHKNLGLKHIWFKKGKSLSFYYNLIIDLCRTPLFLIPCIIKCVTAFFLVSPHTADLYIPFIKYLVFFKSDPYAFFYSHGLTNAFPYPGFMLWVLAIPYGIATLFFQGIQYGVTNLDLFLLRVPLLIADIGLLLILLSWFKKQKNEVMWLYWCSPILFYITYVGGQLDVLPIFFLFCFLYFLFKEYDTTAFIFLGLAISVKTGMVIAFPFAALYLYKERESIQSTLVTLSIPITTYLLLNFSYIYNHSYVEMVLKTKEQFRVFDLVFRYSDSLVIYIIPVVYCILFFKFATYKRYSRDLFMVYFGITFFVLSLCIPPMQGWYYWVIPFAIYFYSKVNSTQRILYHSVIVAYFVYFAVIQNSDFLSVFTFATGKSSTAYNIYSYGNHIGLPMDFLVNCSFTILQALLLLNIYWIYRKGIQQYIRQKMHYKPFLIGVVGDSGSGKTTFAELMEGVFGSRNTSVIAGDDMHKWERGDEMWSKYTHLDPIANELHADIKNIYTIKKGNSISRKRYNHSTGTFEAPIKHEARRLVVFEGLHAFFLTKVRKAFDLKVYVAPEDQLRLHWKILRDLKERGYTKGQVLDSLEKRKDDSERYILTQERHSDIIISLRNNSSLGSQLGNEDIQLRLSLFITCANDIFLEPLFKELEQHFSIDYFIFDEKQRIKFSGDIDSVTIQKIAEKLLPEIFEISEEKRNWQAGYQGVIQLFVTFYMFRLMALEEYD